MKENIRKQLIEKRRKQSKEENRKKSKEIKEKLFNLKEFKDSKTVLFYVSYDNEVFTHDMIKECLLTGKNVVVPVTDKENKCLILSKLENWNDLKISSYSILEPGKERIKKVNINEIDLIIVPGVAFDLKGNRLGHGKGYYDYFLKDAKEIMKIGLAFEFQIVESIPANKHDVPVNMIITEKRIIKC